MIDFTLTEHDEKTLAMVREQALITRSYARYYDEHEEEFIPDVLPEADDHPSPYTMLAKIGPEDTPISIMSMLMSAGQTWGDYSVRLRRTSGPEI